MKKIIVFGLLFLFAQTSFSQEVYEVGASQVTIEPSKEMVSLALGGYAAPWEGRFTIQWKEKGKCPSYTAITGINDQLFRVSDNLLLRSKLPDVNRWEKVGTADHIAGIAGSGNTIYAITQEGLMLKTDLEQAVVKWEKVQSAPIPFRAITSAGKKLYALDNEGEFWTGTILQNKVEWVKSGFQQLPDVVSLAAVGGKLVALTKEGVLYHCGGSYHDNKWIKIGYKNGVTVREDIQTLLVLDNDLYGVDHQNILYASEHRSKGDLSVNALSIGTGKSRVIIVGLDVTGFNDSFATLVKEELFKTRGISPSALFLNASHTHFAPVAQKWPTWQESNRQADSSWLYVTVKQAIVKAVNEALDNAHPAELFFGRGDAQLGFNRSLSDHPELVDTNVDVIRYQYSDGKPGGFLFMAACHPVHSTAGELTFTGHLLFLQGTAGDINPLDNSELITGDKLATEVVAIANRPMQKISGPVTFYLDTVGFMVDLKSREEIVAFTKDEKENPNQMLIERNQTWGDIMLKDHQNGKSNYSMPVYVHTVNIGNWKLVGFSREATTPYGFRIKKLWPDKLVSVAGYTNDVSSYLPTRLHIEQKNYEGLGSFYWYGMPDTFPIDVEETIFSHIIKNNR